MVYKWSIFLLCSLTSLYGDIDSNTSTQYSYIDITHAMISDQFEHLSKSIDTTLSSNFEKPYSSKIDKVRAKSASLDSFFQTNKFINQTDETFVRINLKSFFYSKEKEDFKVKVRAHIPLSRTKKHYNLFFEDITQDNVKTTLKDNLETSSPSIGLNYFAAETYGIKSKYSVGTSGIKPFLRARYNLNFQTKNWIIELIQQFKYSSDKKFEEKSTIYFDKLLSSSELFRFLIFRGTQENENGMDYGTSLKYFFTLNKTTAISLKQSFFANTKYQHITSNHDLNIKHKTFSGVHDYETQFNLRKNIWKKWFYYELTPGVNFHKKHRYKANYSIYFSIDMYFGKLYKK